MTRGKLLRQRAKALACFVAAGLLYPFCAAGQGAPNIFWQRQSIYQIITDRFFDGDPSNNSVDGNFDPAGHSGISVHGGDFKGIEQKLDYIKSLGVTAIWISPIVLNVRGEFHGYDARDFYKVDPHWGTMADLQHLVRAAHARGILVIDDIVVNHGGNLIDSADSGYPNFKYPGHYQMRFRNPDRQYAPPFDLNADHPAITNLFHDHGFIQDYNDPTQLELGELSSLDDFKTETPFVREQMTRIYQYWIEQAGFDGYRIDTVKHVEMGFWEQWSPAIRSFAAAHGKTNFFMFGEVPHHLDAKCGSYTGYMGETNAGAPKSFKLDSVLDYTLYFKIEKLFAEARETTSGISNHYAAVAASYDPATQQQLVTFLDNHDQPRFLSFKGATIDRLKVALVFLHTTTGIPCLYYGTEQAFDGAKDPWNREDMFAGKFEWGPSLGDNFNMTHPLYQWVARLNDLRRLYPALQTGAQSNLWSNPDGPGLFVFTRRLGSQEVLVILNTASTQQYLPGCATSYPPGTLLRNLMNEKDRLTVGKSGRIPLLTVPGTTAEVFVADSQFHPLDPVVIAVSPGHDATNVPPTAAIVVRFSKRMNRASVEKAFSTVPPVVGKISWTTARDELTFKPSGAGFPPGSTVSVRLGESARDAVSGNRFYAGFESRYKCAGVGF